MKVLALVLAGGAGQRLSPLTNRCAKPFLPFGGVYRLIDITLSNCINSDLREVFVLTQNGASGLNRYLRRSWGESAMASGKTIDILSPGGVMRGGRYSGTADAVYQNLERLCSAEPDLVLVLSADHVYRMDYRKMIDWHVRRGADLTVATTQVPVSDSHRFGILETDSRNTVVEFVEKPQYRGVGGATFNRGVCHASMGIYLFNADLLYQALAEDAENERSVHDFGHNVLPRLVKSSRVTAFDFSSQEERYWRDVGTIDSYYDANMDLVTQRPRFDVYDTGWPIHTRYEPGPPARFTQSRRRTGMALDSLVANGCVISGSRVRRSVLCSNVMVGSLSDVERAVVLPGVRIGQKCRIYRAIIDEGIELPDGTDIGVDLAADRRAGRHVSDSGIVVVTAITASATPEIEAAVRATA